MGSEYGLATYRRNGANLTATNPLSTLTGHRRRAFGFDGTNDHHDWSSRQFDIGVDYTWSLRCRPESHSDWQGPASWGRAANTDHGTFAKLGSSGIEFHHYTAGDVVHTVTDSGTLSLDTWHTVTAVYNSTTQMLSGYVDGSLIGVATGVTALVSQANSSNATTGGEDYYFNMGRWNGSNYYDGNVDDVRMYNKALTQAQVQAIHNSGNTDMYWTCLLYTSPSPRDRG